MLIIKIAITITVVTSDDFGGYCKGKATVSIGDRRWLVVVLAQVSVEIKPHIGVHQRRAGGRAAGNQVARFD